MNAHYELAAMLLDAGADPHGGGDGWTALHVISNVRTPGSGSNDPAPPSSGNLSSLDLVRKLVAKGANVNLQTTRSRNVGPDLPQYKRCDALPACCAHRRRGTDAAPHR